MRQPQHEPDEKHDGDGEDGGKKEQHRQQKKAIAPSVAARLCEVPLQQLIVATVGLPGNVEDVSEERHGTHQYADAEIDDHARERNVRDASHPPGERKDERDEAGDDVADTGHETDDAIDTEAYAGARDAKCFVEQKFEPREGLIAEEPRTASPPSAGCWRRGGRNGVRNAHEHEPLGPAGRGTGPFSDILQCYNH